MGFLLLAGPPSRASKTVFALGTIAVAGGLFALFQWLPRYASPGWLGIIRPTLVAVPLLWIAVGITLWRRRRGDRIVQALAFYAFGTGLSHLFMLYSDEATSKFAMTAHFGVFGAGLYLLLSLVQMGTADTGAACAYTTRNWRRGSPRARRSSRASTPTCAAKWACATEPKCAR